MRTSPSPTKTRELVIQALYQKTISGDSNTKVLKELKQTQKNLKTEKVAEIIKNIKSLEQNFLETIGKFSNIPTSRIGEIELSILYLALYEISQSKLDKPIIINEAIKLNDKIIEVSQSKFLFVLKKIIINI